MLSTELSLTGSQSVTPRGKIDEVDYSFVFPTVSIGRLMFSPLSPLVGYLLWVSYMLEAQRSQFLRGRQLNRSYFNCRWKFVGSWNECLDIV